MFFISFHFYPFSPFFCEGEPHALPAQAFRIFYHSFFYDSEPINMLRALDCHLLFQYLLHLSFDLLEFWANC